MTPIDEYISTFPLEIRNILENIREIIRQEAPEAIEKISYQMPTFYLNGNLIHFAAFKKHIGLYPTPDGIIPFSQRLAQYKTSKGAIQFPLDKPIPYELIRDITRYRVESMRNKKAIGKK